MNRHSSSQEISGWATGERNSDIDEHALNCSTCQTELAGFKTTLSQFRKCARSWAEEECSPEAQTIAQIKRHSYRTILNAFGWAATAITICILATFSMRENPSAPVTREFADGDAALLQRVDAEISQSVPSSFECLAASLSWEASGGSQRGARRKLHHSSR